MALSVTDRKNKLHFLSGYPVFQLPIISIVSAFGFWNCPEAALLHTKIDLTAEFRKIVLFFEVE